MTSPDGGTRKKWQVQDILNLVFDETEGALKAYLTAGVTIDPGDIQIGAVEIKNHDTDIRCIVDTDHRLYVRSILQLANAGSPVDVDGTNAVPSTIVDPVQGFSDDLWRFGLDAETIGLMAALNGSATSVFGDGTNKFLEILVKDGTPPAGYSSLFELLTYLGAITQSVQRDEGWTAWNGTDDPLPANATGRTMTAEGLIQHQVLIINDENPATSIRTIQYSFNGGTKWFTLKPAESRLAEDIHFETWKLRSGDSAGGEAYRAEAFTEA